MTDRASSLKPASLREIIDHLDDCLRIIARTDRHTISEIKIKSMLSALRRQMLEYLTQRINEDLQERQRLG
jgi:hypothetical protein